MRHHLRPKFQNAGGKCWTTALDPELFPESDNPSDPSGSAVLLSEDGVDLGPPHTAHQLIMRDGRGAFSHWNQTLYFSTTDGTDPNKNGRDYSVRLDREKYFARRAAHAIGIVESYIRRLPGGRTSLNGARVLEIGPGRDMGTVLLLAGLGARSVCAIDRFVGAWQTGWHDSFIDALVVAARDRLALDLAAMASEIKAAQTFSTGPIRFFAEALEKMNKSDGIFDVTLSHSVFEHFYSVSEAAQALHAVSASGSVGAHHVDFRDHRNFGEPLEFLLVPDDVYSAPANNDDYGRGNRTRADEMADLLKAAGFEEIEFTIESCTPADYLTELEPRLRACNSRFRRHPISRLDVLSGGFLLRCGR
jgi:hypothetical protein